eukprot:2793124-Amphidinium_carterae.1
MGMHAAMHDDTLCNSLWFLWIRVCIKKRLNVQNCFDASCKCTTEPTSLPDRSNEHNNMWLLFTEHHTVSLWALKSLFVFPTSSARTCLECSSRDTLPLSNRVARRKNCRNDGA